jgi:hypothetical protein
MGDKLWWKATNQPTTLSLYNHEKSDGPDGWMARQKLCNSYNILFLILEKRHFAKGFIHFSSYQFCFIVTDKKTLAQCMIEV